MKICIYGAGAIGGYLGVQLALAERMSAWSRAALTWPRCVPTGSNC